MFLQHKIEPGQIWKSQGVHYVRYVEIVSEFYYNSYEKIHRWESAIFKCELSDSARYDIKTNFQKITNPKKLEKCRNKINEIKLERL